jgi:hypothetical protein
LFAFRLSTDIDAPASSVWHALCDPREVIAWESGVREALDAPPDYPRPGQHVRWRTRAGAFRVLHDRPLEVEPERLLRSLLSLGPLRYDETYTIEALPEGCRLSVQVRGYTAVPLIGILADGRLGAATRRDFEAALASIKARCERRTDAGAAATS